MRAPTGAAVDVDMQIVGLQHTEQLSGAPMQQ
jgi:hypothetical protein